MKRTGFDHPKIGRLCKLMGIPRYAAVGIVESLWHFAAKHAPAGDVGKWSDEEIATSMGWNDEAETLVSALVESRLLDQSDGARLIVHDWDDHCEDGIHCALARKTEFFANGKMPKLSRLGKAERPQIEAAYRDKAIAESTHKNARKRAKARAKPSLALPSPAKPCPASSCSEPAEPASEQPVLVFPCVGDGPSDFPLMQAKLDEYEQSYPGINALAECRKALQWCRDNPLRRKTFGGMPKFLNQWLARAQDGGGSGIRRTPESVEVQQL